MWLASVVLRYWRTGSGVLAYWRIGVLAINQHWLALEVGEWWVVPNFNDEGSDIELPGIA